MKKYFLVLLLASFTASAQLTEQQYLTAYKEGVNAFNQGQFETAYTKLSPLTTAAYKNKVTPYAHVYAALAAEEKGNTYQTKNLLRSLIQNFPDWEKIDEARILYAKANLREAYYEEALKTLTEIEDKKYNSIKNGLLDEYIPNVKTIMALKNLNQKFPNYRSIAKVLVDKIQANRFNSKADLELSDMLTNRFNLISSGKTTPASSKPQAKVFSKDQLAFGLLLPFDLVAKDQPSSGFMYVYDMYAGMSLAVEALKEAGIDLHLHTYDVQRTNKEYNAAAQKKGFQDLDLIFGPLYAAPNDLAIAHINKSNKIQVQPISNNLSLLEKSKNSFLAQPSHTQQSKKTFDYIHTLGLNKTVSIYYGSARKDSIFADIYSKEAKSRGYKVVEFKKFNNQKIKREQGHIFFSGDVTQGTKFIQSLSEDNPSTETVISASSFSWDRPNTSLFKDNIALIYPEFVNTNKEAVQAFDKAYFEKYAIMPSYYSYLGYDLAYYFATMLKDGREVFNDNIQLGEYTEGFLLSGYDFRGKIKQNDLVPIVKVVNDEYQEVYR